MALICITAWTSISGKRSPSVDLFNLTTAHLHRFSLRAAEICWSFFLVNLPTSMMAVQLANFAAVVSAEQAYQRQQASIFEESLITPSTTTPWFGQVELQLKVC